MATYVIVSSTKTNLAPGEVTAGDTITVSGGDNTGLGSGSRFGEIDGENGNDTTSLGNDGTGAKLVGGGGDGTFWVGHRTTITDRTMAVRAMTR